MSNRDKTEKELADYLLVMAMMTKEEIISNMQSASCILRVLIRSAIYEAIECHNDV